MEKTTPEKLKQSREEPNNKEKRHKQQQEPDDRFPAVVPRKVNEGNGGN